MGARKTPIRNIGIAITDRLRVVSNTPTLDAQVLLVHVLGKPRAWVLAHPEAPLSSNELQRLDELLTQLERGVPLPYVIGHWEFYGLDFIVTPDVLIPRPETELLVEQAIAWLRHPGNQSKIQNPKPVVSAAEPSKIVDIGTGSGCIAIALAVNLPNLHLVATDISTAALQVARQNALKHGVADRIHFVHADLLFSLTPALSHRERENLPPATFNLQPSPFILILANLPYIPTTTLQSLPIYRREPTLALDGGTDGLNHIRRLLADAPRCLAPRGALLLEIEASQGDSVKALARQSFPHADIRLLPDLAGHDRVLSIQRGGETPPPT